MTFTRAPADASKLPKVRERSSRRVAGTVAFAALLLLAALVPYDRLTPEPTGFSDLVPLGPNDPPIHTADELSKVYGISAAAEAHFRVDESGIHYLRERTTEDEERK